MATTARSKSKTTDDDRRVVTTIEEAHDAGFFGEKVDPHPNSAYTLASGPDSPPASLSHPHPIDPADAAKEASADG